MSPKVAGSVYCTNPQDRLAPAKCALCVRCYIYVVSNGGRWNGMCPYGGPFRGVTRDNDKDGKT